MEIVISMNSRCLEVCFLLFIFIINAAHTDVLPTILWASYDPFFRKLGESPRTVFLKDQINFLCPNTIIYPEHSTDQYSKDTLYANIYKVDKQGFDGCNATGGFKIKICNDPSSFLYSSVTILKKDDLPTSSLPDFKAGHLHYFIDTSDGSKENVTNLIGGKCRTHNMKMKMYVCSSQGDKACPYGNKVTNGGWSSWGLCSQSGTQTRLCNNPMPSNGGIGCQGNSARECTLPTTAATTTTESNFTSNDTVTPKKEKRTSDSLGTLSDGELVAIILAALAVGVVFGIILGIFLARKTKLKHMDFNNVVRRRAKGNKSVDELNTRNSVVSTAKMRPFSTVSNDTTLTGITGFTSYNDIYDASTS